MLEVHERERLKYFMTAIKTKKRVVIWALYFYKIRRHENFPASSKVFTKCILIHSLSHCANLTVSRFRVLHCERFQAFSFQTTKYWSLLKILKREFARMYTRSFLNFFRTKFIHKLESMLPGSCLSLLTEIMNFSYMVLTV